MVFVVVQLYFKLHIILPGVSEPTILSIGPSRLMANGNMATRSNHQLAKTIHEEFYREKNKTTMIRCKGE